MGTFNSQTFNIQTFNDGVEMLPPGGAPLRRRIRRPKKRLITVEELALPLILIRRIRRKRHD